MSSAPRTGISPVAIVHCRLGLLLLFSFGLGPGSVRFLSFLSILPPEFTMMKSLSLVFLVFFLVSPASPAVGQEIVVCSDGFTPRDQCNNTAELDRTHRNLELDYCYVHYDQGSVNLNDCIEQNQVLRDRSHESLTRCVIVNQCIP